jgi:hypothetical protein
MPENYRKHGEASSLPETTRVWLVQESGEKYSGIVSAAYNFEGGWDDGSLVAGCNGKSYPHTAIGRHGNFLQWGFGEPPAKMTESGRKLMVNCICYIRKFAGRRPLVRETSWNRRFCLHYKAFGDDLAGKYKGREGELYRFCRDNIDLLRYEEKRTSGGGRAFWFSIDDELRNLGITSNRRVSTLEQLIGFLPDKPSISRRANAAAALKLLQRYTNEEFAAKAQWQQWLETNRDRLFFSDFGGYMFYVAPKDYADTSTRPAADESFWFPK